MQDVEREWKKSGSPEQKMEPTDKVKIFSPSKATKDSESESAYEDFEENKLGAAFFDGVQERVLYKWILKEETEWLAITENSFFFSVGRYPSTTDQGSSQMLINRDEIDIRKLWWLTDSFWISNALVEASARLSNVFAGPTKTLLTFFMQHAKTIREEAHRVGIRIKARDTCIPETVQLLEFIEENTHAGAHPVNVVTIILTYTLFLWQSLHNYVRRCTLFTNLLATVSVRFPDEKYARAIAYTSHLMDSLIEPENYIHARWNFRKTCIHISGFYEGIVSAEKQLLKHG